MPKLGNVFHSPVQRQCYFPALRNRMWHVHGADLFENRERHSSWYVHQIVSHSLATPAAALAPTKFPQSAVAGFLPYLEPGKGRAIFPILMMEMRAARYD
jgi:hypothetical protein